MNLAISFTDQSESFTAGVELGRILQRMQTGVAVIENQGFPVHSCNREVLTRCCEHYGYVAEWGSEYKEWVYFTAWKRHLCN